MHFVPCFAIQIAYRQLTMVEHRNGPVALGVWSSNFLDMFHLNHVQFLHPDQNLVKCDTIFQIILYRINLLYNAIGNVYHCQMLFPDHQFHRQHPALFHLFGTLQEKKIDFMAKI